jgi:hypothetical protein
MDDFVFSESHEFVSREVNLEGRLFVHRNCRICGRDFVKQSGGPDWRATHLGMFRFNLLDELTNRRWLFDECPGKQLKAEENDVRTEQEGTRLKASRWLK